jgi:hypothetical protein
MTLSSVLILMSTAGYMFKGWWNKKPRISVIINLLSLIIRCGNNIFLKDMLECLAWKPRGSCPILSKASHFSRLSSRLKLHYVMCLCDALWITANEASKFWNSTPKGWIAIGFVLRQDVAHIREFQRDCGNSIWNGVVPFKVFGRPEGAKIAVLTVGLPPRHKGLTCLWLLYDQKCFILTIP